jgi:hypothetical protein
MADDFDIRELAGRQMAFNIHTTINIWSIGLTSRNYKLRWELHLQVGAGAANQPVLP